MSISSQQRTQKFVQARKQHPAWLLLASPRAPLVLGCLTTLFEDTDDGIAVEDALQSLSEMLVSYALQDEYDIDSSNTTQQAGRELREWIRRGLVIERGQRIYETDALSSAIQFIESLDKRIMTSTASRLSVVQREIENLEVGLNPSPESRINALKRKISELEQELADAEAGNVPVLSEDEAIERIREVYGLAMGLRADFRRVEDSWREADKVLRQSIISERYHRGEIVDRLLDGQEALLNTPEGRVFDSFQQQLRQSIELENMRYRLQAVLQHPAAEKALDRVQLHDFRWLPPRLVKESQSVLQARARSEKDVKGFLKTGLAAEHHRVGQLLNDIMAVALELDWSRQAVRSSPTSLPPVGLALGTLPIAERLRFKSLEQDAEGELDLTTTQVDLESIDDDFWAALDGLDREALLRDTLQLLAEQNQPMSLADLAQHLPPSHDLETLTLWLAMAREAGIEIRTSEVQELELLDNEQRRWLFRVPYFFMSSQDLNGIDWEF